MNGRVYDSTIGRFLSADPFVTEPFNTQNLNRYSYVHNNPLTLIDPSGFENICRQTHECGPEDEPHVGFLYTLPGVQPPEDRPGDTEPFPYVPRPARAPAVPKGTKR
jgi:hypothetical protein